MGKSIFLFLLSILCIANTLTIASIWHVKEKHFPERRSYYLSPEDFGAKCDNKSDDSDAFSGMLINAASTGRPIQIVGKCFIRNISLPQTGGKIEISGNGSTLTTDQNVFLFKSQKNTPKTEIFIHDINFVEENKNTGQAIVIENNSSNRSVGGSRIERVKMYGFQRAINITNSSDNTIENIYTYGYNNTNSESILINGLNMKNGLYSSNNNLINISVVGGYAVHIVGAVQGTYIDNLRSLQSTYGVKTDHEDSQEGITIKDSYLEGYYGGAVIDNNSYISISNTAADSISGVDKTWHGFHIGPSNSSSIQFNNNSVFHYFGNALSPVEIMGNAIVTENIITGLGSPKIACMRLVSPKAIVNKIMLVEGNICWETGGIDKVGTNFVGGNNIYNLPDGKIGIYKFQYTP